MLTLFLFMNFFNENFLCRKFIRSHLVIFKLSFKSWNIIFFGSDNFSLLSLKALHKNVESKLINNLKVVTLNEKNSVYKYAVSNNLKVTYWPPAFNDEFDFGVIVSFGKLIPLKMIEKFPLGIINVHASLLPRWRGATPIFHAIKSGDTISGITVIKINQKFDTGDMVMKRAIPIGKNELFPSVYSRLSKIGAECLIEVVKEMPECLNNSVPQPKEGCLNAPKVPKEVSVIRWNEMNSTEIYNLYRALYSVSDLETTWQGVQVKVLCMSLEDTVSKIKEQISQFSFENEKKETGSVKYCSKKQCLIVWCKDNTSVNICSVKIKGKLFSANQFNRGFLTQVPKNLRKFIS